MSNQPKTLPHNFILVPLRSHFTKTPNPTASNKLIDLPAADFLDTEEEITIIAAALYVLSVEYDKLEEKDRPKDAEGVRKWIIKHREGVVSKLAGKIEPPFTAFTIDQMLKDVGAMMEELLMKTLSPASSANQKK